MNVVTQQVQQQISRFLYNTISVGGFYLHATASALGSSQLSPSIKHLLAPKAPARV